MGHGVHNNEGKLQSFVFKKVFDTEFDYDYEAHLAVGNFLDLKWTVKWTAKLCSFQSAKLLHIV